MRSPSRRGAGFPPGAKRLRRDPRIVTARFHAGLASAAFVRTDDTLRHPAATARPRGAGEHRARPATWAPAS